MRILFPTHLDRSANSTATVLREVALRLPDLHFCSFSKPESPEDRALGQRLWRTPHIQRITLADLLRTPFALAHHHAATRRALALVQAARLRSLGQARHIFTAAQVDAHDPFSRQYAAAIRRADAVVAVSRSVASEIEAQLGRRVTAVIPNGVDLDFFAPTAAAPIDTTQTPDLAGFDPSAPYVLFVGILTPRKRPDIFIRLAGLLPDVPFLLLGRHFVAQEREMYAAQARAYPNVRLLGHRTRAEVRNLMAGARALIFPSEQEGLPLTVLEAAAMGLPTLAQPKSALPEVVYPGVTGWLLPEDPLDAWAARLHTILNWSPAERQHFGQVARAFMVERHSWDAVARQYAALYRQVARRTGMIREAE